MSNTIGRIFRLTTFGESHGAAIGGVIDGVPAGVKIDIDKIQAELDRRRPGRGAFSTTRNEADRVEILSGIFNGTTLGTPIGFIIRNEDQHSADYDNLRDIYRPSHADYTYAAKYGVRDHRGGGRSSARETACRVVAGAVAQQILESLGIKVTAYTGCIAGINTPPMPDTPRDEDIYANDLRCPHPATAHAMNERLTSLRDRRMTAGGIVECRIDGVEAGLGEPLYDKLQALLASAMMSINAAKGVEFGLGFGFASATGPDANDPFEIDSEGKVRCTTNNSGGIQGGISNGMPITLRVVFKPVATSLQETETIDTDGNKVVVQPRGRHDITVIPRAVPVVKAMAACVMLDAWLMNRCTRL